MLYALYLRKCISLFLPLRGNNGLWSMRNKFLVGELSAHGLKESLKILEFALKLCYLLRSVNKPVKRNEHLDSSRHK